MFRRILIANRGEVAARVLRTCNRLGIETVAVASVADRDAQWLSEATVVVGLGGARAVDSYLDQDALLDVAMRHRCAAVHPGWGFLAENELFALRCASAGVTFIGPAPRHQKAMGDKALARKTMKDLGLDPIPGCDDPVADADEALRVADRIGYPVLLKAVAGGGGRGMRPVDRPEQLREAFASASAEALAAFGDGRMYLERRIVGGRHVEVQIIGDQHGHAVFLGDRECSLQRRHQKVLEEAPSPGLSAAERARTLPIVAEVVRKSGYVNAGTIEMLLDADGRLWFMEMNTRLQVEHPVSEAITGIDLVEWQLRVAANEPLPLRQDEITVTGHAIECRINAEDPAANFKPCPGVVSALQFPTGEGIRVDTHLRPGDRIPPNYDSMIAKLIITAPTRSQAIERMAGALAGTRIDGVTTNLALHRQILGWDEFVSGRYDTGTLERRLSATEGR